MGDDSITEYDTQVAVELGRIATEIRRMNRYLERYLDGLEVPKHGPETPEPRQCRQCFAPLQEIGGVPFKGCPHGYVCAACGVCDACEDYKDPLNP